MPRLDRTLWRPTECLPLLEHDHFWPGLVILRSAHTLSWPRLDMPRLDKVLWRPTECLLPLEHNHSWPSLVILRSSHTLFWPRLVILRSHHNHSWPKLVILRFEINYFSFQIISISTKLQSPLKNACISSVEKRIISNIVCFSWFLKYHSLFLYQRMNKNKQ
jgi:hypothetical protein